MGKGSPCGRSIDKGEQDYASKVTTKGQKGVLRAPGVDDEDEKRPIMVAHTESTSVMTICLYLLHCVFIQYHTACVACSP